MASNDLDLETYKAQLEQVEAALLIDEENEDLIKLKQDLLEVISLSQELEQINEVTEDVSKDEETVTPASSASSSKKKEWKQGDRVQAVRQADGKLHNAKIEMIADDGFTCVVKFDNIGAVEVVQMSSLQTITDGGGEQQPTGQSASGGQSKPGKLTKDEIEKRKEIKKKKLLKKKQRMKDFEEQREAEKQRWQTFFKKGTTKGKSKMKGLNKKSIFASREDGQGKIGVGTCGTSGNKMTSYTPASAYMYKK